MVLPRFLTELKRRKVYRVALVYAGVGWALLEAADLVLPRLALPDWTVNVVLAVVLLGFPLALVFAWIFDLSPQGIVRTEPLSPAGHHHRLNVPAIVEFVLICVLVVTVGYLYVDRLSLQKRLVQPEMVERETSAIPNPEKYRAIAVLPFADMSEAGDQAWFAEGIAEELLIALSQVKPLSVMARTSSFAFKGAGKTVAEIADILGVQAVLEGSVRRTEGRVRVTAQLVDADTGFHIWSGSYERQITDIFQLQDELAKSVVEALHLQLGISSDTVLVAEQTHSPEAYDWYIRGQALFDWDNPHNLQNAINYFERAVEVDQDFARAWGNLALAQGLLNIWKPLADVGPASTRAYERALAIEPHQSEALAAKAYMLLLLEYDWEKAGRLLQRAMDESDNASTLTIYGMLYLHSVDRIADAIRLHEVAEQRDPLHAGIKSNLAHLHLYNGDFALAAEKAQSALALKENHLLALWALIEAWTALGEYETVSQLISQLSPEIMQYPSVRIRFGLYQLARGELDKADSIYQEYIENPHPSGRLIVAKLALGLGHTEQAIDLMERQVDDHSWTYLYIRVLFRNDPAVKDHPRYLALLKRIGLDDESVAALHQKLSFD
jgi:TolB-like protein